MNDSINKEFYKNNPKEYRNHLAICKYYDRRYEKYQKEEYILYGDVPF